MFAERPLKVFFFKTPSGKEPVREWIKSLLLQDKKAIGEDIKTVQFGWPLGMPLIRKVETDLWEIRTHISSGIARVMFTVQGSRMILLHGFIKKAEKIPSQDLDLARIRLSQVKGEK